MIAVTSFAMLGDKERIMEAGFDHYICQTHQYPGTSGSDQGDPEVKKLEMTNRLL